MNHKFVDTIPSELEDNTLYISLEYNVTKHLCPCGCGSEIVATLSPSRWQLSYDGETVSLTPSIGNWHHKCKSHYYITENNVVWAYHMSKNKIEAAIQKDQKELEQYASKKREELNEHTNKKKSLFERIKNRIKLMRLF